MLTAPPLLHHLPATYAHLLPEFFEQTRMNESRATCGDCPMCSQAGRDTGVGDLMYLAETKCCTYHPTIPNFIVGALLADSSIDHDEGRRRVREKIAKRVGVTPLWVAAPRKYSVLFDAAKERSFGRSAALKCPYYEAGNCTVWRYREAVCSTYFCRHERGARGQALWSAVKEYLSQLELVLADAAAKAVDPEVSEPRIPPLKLTEEDMEDLPPPAAEYAKHWRTWEGREEAFYRETASFIAGLDRAAVARLAEKAPRVRDAFATVLQRQADVAAPLEQRLVLNRKLKARPASGGNFVHGYAPTDPVFVSDGLARVLSTLSPDEPLEAARERLRAQGIDLTDDVLRGLRDHGVLVPGGP